MGVVMPNFSKLTQSVAANYKEYVKSKGDDEMQHLIKLRSFVTSLKALSHSVNFDATVNQTKILFKAGEIADGPVSKKDLGPLVAYYSSVADAMTKVVSEAKEKSSRFTP